MIYRIGSILLDTSFRELRRGDEQLRTQPRVVDLIFYLLEHRARPHERFVMLHLAGIRAGAHTNPLWMGNRNYFLENIMTLGQ